MSRCNIYKENVNFPFSEYFIWIMKKWVVMKKYCWWERLPPLWHPWPPPHPRTRVQPPAQPSLLWSIILTKCYVLPLNSKNPWKINIFMLVLYSIFLIKKLAAQHTAADDRGRIVSNVKWKVLFYSHFIKAWWFFIDWSTDWSNIETLKRCGAGAILSI